MRLQIQAALRTSTANPKPSRLRPKSLSRRRRSDPCAALPLQPSRVSRKEASQVLSPMPLLAPVIYYDFVCQYVTYPIPLFSLLLGRYQADTPKIALQLDRGAPAEGLRRHTPGGKDSCLFAKTSMQQLRSGVRRLSADRGHLPKWHRTHRAGTIRVTLSSDPNAAARQPGRLSAREVSRLAPRFYIELRRRRANEFRHVAFCGKHPAQKKQMACLHRFT